jgi:broad specificity phosphatase PhoE
VAIFLIRHGETALNAARIVQPAATPLSERGLEQARRLARRLASEGVQRILASHLPRAHMTAEVIADLTGAPIRTAEDLQERNYGDIRGTPYSELDVDIMDPDYAPPAGETWEEFHVRVDSVWERVADVARRTDGNLAVVTHGLVCYSLALRRLRLEPAGATAPRRWGNTSLTIVDSRSPWTVRLLNCTAHLDTGRGEGALDPSETSVA